MNKMTLKKLNNFEKKVKNYSPHQNFPDDKFIKITIQEAILAVREGNIGVGAVLVNKNGDIIQRGHNHLFYPYFRSDLHAEMDVMTKFEERYKNITSMKEFILFTSLEPCPMCLTRLICSGVHKIIYGAEDKEGANVKELNCMPPIWIKLSENQQFMQANCSKILKALAFEIFLLTAEEANTLLLDRNF